MKELNQAHLILLVINREPLPEIPEDKGTVLLEFEMAWHVFPSGFQHQKKTSITICKCKFFLLQNNVNNTRQTDLVLNSKNLMTNAVKNNYVWKY